jgi:low affinity Fe/Cu permease
MRRKKMDINEKFSQISHYLSGVLEGSRAFVIACTSIIVWMSTGPLFAFSDTWQLVINTVTNIVTFIMVFLIQNTQNRDGDAIQIKLDELIRSQKGAHNALLDIESLTQEQLNQIKEHYEKLARLARVELKKGGLDTDVTKI